MDRYRGTHRRVLATLSGFSLTLLVGALVFSARPKTAHGLEVEPSPADACGARSHSCAELTNCLGGSLPEGIGCVEMSAEEARQKGLILE